MWGELKGSSLRRGGQGSARGEPWSGGGRRRAPPSRNCRCRRASPATAPLAWKSPSPLAFWLLPGPWWLHPTRTNQWGRGPAPTLVPPSKEKESCCASQGTPGEAGGTWLWEHHSSPPRMLHQRQSSCVLGEFRFTLLSGRGSGNAR